VIISSDVRIVGWHGLANRSLDVPAWPAMKRRPEDTHDRNLLALLFVIELFWVGGLIWFAAHSL
jgi:hypothetical protein